MAIDYRGVFPCKVREAVSDADLLDMEKAGNRAQVVLDVMRNDPRIDKSKPESEWTFKTVIRGPDGPRQAELRIEDCLAQAAPLEPLARHCRGCPFNIRATDFGCGGAIGYPISAQAERWLMSRLPADLNTPRGRLLTRAITDFKFDGSVIDATRSRKDVYESDVPVERKWGGLLSRKTRITSSQILHMTFGVGNLQATHAKLIAYFLGFLGDDFNIANDPADAPLPQDDTVTLELKYFLAIAALAGISEKPVLVDA